MVEEKVSIIVPVYNVEKHLRQCLDSIVNQTYANIEVLLVDDGSPDHSGRICDEYASADHRIRVFHKENGGVSAARNYALAEATGAYIVFADSDDYLGPDYVKHLMSSDADYVASGCYQQDASLNWNPWTQHPAKISKSDLRQNPTLINKIPTGTVWAKRYRKELLTRHGILFHTNIKRGEDTLFNSEYVFHCDTFAILDQYDYFYRYGGEATGKLEARLFEWSVLSVKKIGMLIGEDTQVFQERTWNNAMLIASSYFHSLRNATFITKLIGTTYFYQICAHPYTRKAIPYGIRHGHLRQAIMIKLYIWPIVQLVKLLLHR